MNGKSIWLLLCAALLSATVHAQDYPNRALRLIIPYPPGGSTDIMGRSVGNKLSEYLGQSVVIDNRPGANTIIGAELASKASPDGYTLLFATMATLVLNPATYKKLPYDPVKDFAPVAKLSEYGYYIAARNGFPASNMTEFVAYARANPGKVSYASTGDGSPAHFGGVLLESLTGIKLIHVPYKGNSQMNVDLIGERVDLSLTGLPSIESLVKSRKIKLIATGAHKRNLQYPEIATIAESGFPGYWMGTWFSIVTRAGTPRPVIVRLNREINRLLQNAEVQKPLLEGGYELASGTPEELDKLIRDGIKLWTEVARKANIQFD